MSLRVDNDRSAAPGAVSPELERQVRVLLSAELAQRGLSLCDDAAAGAAIGSVAAVTLVATEIGADGPVVVDVRIDDSVTHKRVARSIDLRRLPANGRALSIAVGVDELLGASWAEIESAAKTTTVQKPAPQPPPLARGAATEAVGHSRRFDVNARVAMTADLAGKPRIGGDVGARAWPWSRLALGLRLGYRAVRRLPGTHGSVTFDSALGAIDFAWALGSPRAPAGLELGAAPELLRVRWEGHPSAGNIGHSGSFWLMAPTAFLSGWASVGGSWKATSTISAGFPLQSASALDDSSELPLSKAPLVTFALGLTWEGS